MWETIKNTITKVKFTLQYIEIDIDLRQKGCRGESVYVALVSCHGNIRGPQMP